MCARYREERAGNFFRKKSISRIYQEIKSLSEKWHAEYCYFPSDTFLAMPKREFDQFVEMYSDFKLPFWIQSRAETITYENAKKLKNIGCHRISIGLEHGNEAFRKKMLKKSYSNKQMIKAARILAEVGIPLSVNNIIGFPDETRELVFETIELNRQILSDTTNAYAFTPFHGTPLHEYCVKKGYLDPDFVFGCVTIDAPLDMPQLRRNEIIGLRKTFPLYARLPREYWDDIQKAERDDDKGRRSFNKLKELYIQKYFS